MPKEVRYFECDFKSEGCSKKPLKTKRIIESHELVCWFNPANKTCCTCGFSFYERQYIQGVMPDGEIGYEPANYERACMNPDGNLLPDDMERAGPHVRPLTGCKGWKHRDDVAIKQEA